MTITILLAAAIVTAVLVWLIQQGRIPGPFDMIVWVIIIVVWLVVLLKLLGIINVPLGQI